MHDINPYDPPGELTSQDPLVIRPPSNVYDRRRRARIVIATLNLAALAAMIYFGAFNHSTTGIVVSTSLFMIGAYIEGIWRLRSSQ